MLRKAVIIVVALIAWMVVQCPSKSRLPEALKCAVILKSPVAGDSLYAPDSVVFRWDVSGDMCDEYDQIINISRDSRFTSGELIADTVPGGVHRFVWHITSGVSANYYWRVKLMGEPFGWSNVDSFRLYFPIHLETPTPVSPDNGASFHDPDSITFVWRSVQNATRYEFQLSDSPSFGSLIVNDTTRDTTVRWLPTEAGDYFWRVRSMLDTLASSWSTTFRISVTITNYVPIPPEPIEPAPDTLFIFPDSVNFVWSEVTGAVGYGFQLASDPSFNGLIMDTIVPETAFVWHDCRGDRFWWRINSIGRDQHSNWTSPLSFSIMPQLLSTITGNFAMAVPRDVFLIALSDSGLFIYDLSNPSSPNLYGESLVRIYGAVDMAVQNNLVFAASPDSDGIRIFDISHLYNPINIFTYDSVPDPIFIEAKQNFLYVLTASSELYWIDRSNLYNPIYHGPIHLPAAPSDLELSGNALFVAMENGEIQVFDISSGEPTPLTTITTAPDPVLLSSNDTLYVASEDGRLWIYNVSDPASPTLIGSTSGLKTRISSIAMSSGHIVYSSRNGYLGAVDISTPGSPDPMGTIALEGEPVNLSCGGHLLFVPSLSQGIKIFSVR